MPRRQAVLEINVAAEVLFAIGAETVALWDNHGGGGNIESAELDARITMIKPKEYWQSFAEGAKGFFAENTFDCACFFGYHAMEGTLGGVLAHTMNSTAVQFYKLNGRYIGEIDIDSAIAASNGIPSCFFCGGDIACSQAKNAVEDIVTVATKKEISRNETNFRDNEELFAEIRLKINEAMQKQMVPVPLEFPCKLEKSFKRVEDSAVYLQKLLLQGIEAAYVQDDILGKDAHTVEIMIYNITDFAKCI